MIVLTDCASRLMLLLFVWCCLLVVYISGVGCLGGGAVCICVVVCIGGCLFGSHDLGCLRCANGLDNVVSLVVY